MNATCRHVDAPNATVLSYDIPVNEKPSSGNWFHCLHATSHALQPMHTVVSVKKPTVIDRDRRPGRMFAVNAFDSWIDTFGSATNAINSFAESPRTNPDEPQWYGKPIWCTTRRRRPTTNGGMRDVTSTRASTDVRAVEIVAHSPFTSPRSRANSGDTSQKNSGCNSASHGSQRDIPPAVWCSVNRYVVTTYG